MSNDGLYPNLSHFQSRAHQNSSSGDINPLIRLPSNNRCSHCQRDLFVSRPGEEKGIGWKSGEASCPDSDEDRAHQYLNFLKREKGDGPSRDGTSSSPDSDEEKAHQFLNFLKREKGEEKMAGEGPYGDHGRCEHCRDNAETCKDPEACEGPFSSSYCGHCRKPSPQELCKDPEVCGGPFSSSYCGHCRKSTPQEVCKDPESCRGPYSSVYCGHCRQPPQKYESCRDPEACRGPYSSVYCGHCRQPPPETCHEGNFDGHEFMFGGESPPRGRNYVMEGNRVEYVVEDLDENGPHWWHHSRHHEIPHHHVGAYSWAPCECGEVPPNAVKVGRDADGGRLYLGRAWHERDLLPAKVAPNHGGAFVPWGGHEHTKFEYEVLMTDSHRVAWVESSKGNVPHHALVVGHTHNGEALYAGRVLHAGSMTPGKIQHSHGVLYIPYCGKELHFDEYEVLVVMDAD